MNKITTLSTQYGQTTGIFHLDGGKFPTTSSYNEIVRGQIVDAVTTNAQERLMRPDYGADIKSLLFDNYDDLVRNDTAKAVKARLEILVQRARIIDVKLTNDPIQLSVRGIDALGTSLVLIDVVYATRLFEGNVSVVVTNNVGGAA